MTSKPPIDEDTQVYHPNQMQGTDGNLFCYQNNLRPCGPDCTAYLPQRPEGAYFEGEAWAHCHLLVNADRVGRHLVILVDLLKKDVTSRSQARAENIRGQKAPGVV